jgi:hypothetical protein
MICDLIEHNESECAFLAHVWALTIMCCLSVCCPSSVSRALFITAGPIDLKLCTYVPLGQITVKTKFRSDLILGLVTRGPKLKMQKSAMTPELMAWSSPMFVIGTSSKDTWHSRFLIWPTFQGQRGQSSSGSVGRARFVTAWAVDLKPYIQ